jgi:spore maturation protein SpmB
MLISKAYPNPVIDFITIEARKEIERIEVVSQIGQTVMAANGFHSKAIRLNIKQLSCGYYFLRAFTTSNETGTVKMIKQ